MGQEFLETEVTQYAFVFCMLGFVYINLFIVISDITILHDMVRRSPEPLGRRMRVNPLRRRMCQISWTLSSKL